jgi:hypothetical protein
MLACRSNVALLLGAGSALVLASLAPPAESQEGHETRHVRPHASKQFKAFTHSTGAYALEHPDDWQAHERGERTNVGAENGLVPAERGFRTVYGAIVQIAADPLAGRPDRTTDGSTRAIVEQVLKRNPHQAVKEPVTADRPLAGAPAFRAVLNGISPVTGKGERAEIVVRQHGETQVFYLVLVSPIDAHAFLDAPLRRLRDSVRIPAR